MSGQMSQLEENQRTSDDSSELSDNYFLQHRNVLVSSILLIVVSVSGAKIEGFEGFIEFGKSVNIGLIVFLILIYSFIHFNLEWIWQALPKYNARTDQMTEIRRSVENSIVPLAEEIGKLNMTLKSSIKDFEDLKLDDRIDGEIIFRHDQDFESRIKAMVDEANRVSNQIDPSNGTIPSGIFYRRDDGVLSVVSGRSIKEIDVEDMALYYIDADFFIQYAKKDLEQLYKNRKFIIEDLRKRAKSSLDEISQIQSDASRILNEYNKIKIPRSIARRMLVPRYASRGLSWWIGIGVPWIATGVAILIYASSCARDYATQLLVLP